MDYIGVFIGGLIIGALIVFLINRFQKKEIEKTFSSLSLQALKGNSEEFLKLANETLAKQASTGAGELESKKKLIDQTLDGIKGNLQKVETLVTDFTKDREKKFGALSSQLEAAAKQTGKLQETTNQLATALASTQARGQWGERMAEDVLRLAGFIENINYLKQKALESTTARPDFTFLLPRNLKINMDVKFPLNNYLNYVKEDSDSEKTKYKEQFLKDARQRIKEVTTREYINREDNTVDYVLVFIPNEQVYCFINENDCSLIDDALKSKVIICSPLSLYAILAIIRQSVDNFVFENTMSQILSLLGAFNKQWELFKNTMDRMGKKIDDASKEYVSLVSTRSNQLERPLKQMENLRKQKGIPEASLSNTELELEGPVEASLLIDGKQEDQEK